MGNRNAGRSADRQIEHVLRRAGFGARPDELDTYTQMSFPEVIETLGRVRTTGVAQLVVTHDATLADGVAEARFTLADGVLTRLS